jgi:hypothetical protein
MGLRRAHGHEIHQPSSRQVPIAEVTCVHWLQGGERVPGAVEAGPGLLQA